MAPTLWMRKLRLKDEKLVAKTLEPGLPTPSLPRALGFETEERGLEQRPKLHLLLCLL